MFLLSLSNAFLPLAAQNELEVIVTERGLTRSLARLDELEMQQPLMPDGLRVSVPDGTDFCEPCH